MQTKAIHIQILAAMELCGVIDPDELAHELETLQTAAATADALPSVFTSALHYAHQSRLNDALLNRLTHLLRLVRAVHDTKGILTTNG